VLCFAVLLRHSCGQSVRDALYSSLRTAVTIGPADGLRDCQGLVIAEVIVAYLVTVVVIAAVAGKVARSSERSP